jgi:cytochrome c oxidase cbb3-type subunit 3
MPEPDTRPQGDRQDQIIPGHTADGIQEYDNPMPAWWLWLFWGSAVFSVVHILGIHVFDFVDTYEDDLTESLEDLQTIRHAYAEANPSLTVDEATLAEYVDNPSMVTAGATHYAAQCASCHGNEGQGLIGPNLTDAYWLHGGTNVDVFNIISQGVVAQGMPPWEAVFSAEERAELVVFIRSIQGTNPPNAKEPQGELVE